MQFLCRKDFKQHDRCIPYLKQDNTAQIYKTRSFLNKKRAEALFISIKICCHHPEGYQALQAGFLHPFAFPLPEVPMHISSRPVG